MKYLLFLSLISLSSMAIAANEWKVVAETTACDEKVQILAKEGEKYVMAVKGDVKTKLFSKDGAAFSEQSLRMTEYDSDASSAEKIHYIHPAYVEANPPQIDLGSKRCKLLSR